MLGFGATFFGHQSKMEAFQTTIMEKNFREHIFSLRGYARDFLSPISGLQDHYFPFYKTLSDGDEIQSAFFGHLLKMETYQTPIQEKFIPGNIFDLKWDTLRIILSPISCPQDHKCGFYKCFLTFLKGTVLSWLPFYHAFVLLGMLFELLVT